MEDSWVCDELMHEAVKGVIQIVARLVVAIVPLSTLLGLLLGLDRIQSQ